MKKDEPLEGVLIEAVSPKNSKPRLTYERQKRINVVSRKYRQSYHPTEIYFMLTQEKYIDPTTGNPISMSAIKTDIKYLHEQWKDEIAMGHKEAKLRHINELKLLRQEAWQKNKLYLVSQTLAQEAQVLGLNQDSANDVFEEEEKEQAIFNLDSLTKEEVKTIGKSLEKILLTKHD